MLSDKPVVVSDDDDVILRRTLSAELRQTGYTVIAYADGIATLKYFTLGERADVLGTDIHMPDSLDGFFRAAEVRDQPPHLPVVLIPGFGSADDGLTTVPGR